VTAADPSGNSASCTIAVTVADVTPPVITTPAPVAEAASAAGAVVHFTVTAVDAVDPNPTLTCTPASDSLFALGTTQVSCTARDASNNASTATFNVVVRDTTAPVLTI